MSRHGLSKRGLLFHGQTSGVTMMIPLDRCPKTNKTRFDCQEAADQAAHDFAQANHFRLAESYRCPVSECGGWHLTSRR